MSYAESQGIIYRMNPQEIRKRMEERQNPRSSSPFDKPEDDGFSFSLDLTPVQNDSFDDLGAPITFYVH